MMMIGPLYWGNGKLPPATLRAATLVHELTHWFADTSDWIYYQGTYTNPHSYWAKELSWDGLPQMMGAFVSSIIVIPSIPTTGDLVTNADTYAAYVYHYYLTPVRGQNWFE
jgi:hypothetical protein